jgi:hypothetical protein
MEQKSKELLLNLLSELNEKGLLYIYDKDESNYSMDWVFFDGEKLCIKIEKI